MLGYQRSDTFNLRGLLRLDTIKQACRKLMAGFDVRPGDPRLNDSGCAILLVSVELDEIMALADRIVVMFEGNIVAEVAGRDASKTQLGLMMANAHDQVAA